MTFNFPAVRELLRRGALTELFIDVLGWEHHRGVLDLVAEQQPWRLKALARKRGLVAFSYTSGSGQAIPPARTRLAIEQQVAETVREHLIIFSDAQGHEAIWQWVRRSSDLPTAPREYTFQRGQPNTELIQRLQGIVFTLDEEADLTHTDVTSRVRQTFDVDRITKRFYENFTREHDAFVRLIEGLPEGELRRWYTSVMLNRLMFTYFIQKKGFLDSDSDYLRKQLQRSRKRGANRFYREFLCPLFFEGLGRPQHVRRPELQHLLGNVPYLNGGLFLPHRIEAQYGEQISIADSAFDRPLAFFERYRWHLDDRPLRHDGEINPEVLGYIFERYINNKQMGAYYTKEDITGYIARSCIIPALFDHVEVQRPQAYSQNGLILGLLRDDPERYIFPEVRKGLDQELPAAVVAGQQDSARRNTWNTPTPSEYGLPMEIWRETLARYEHASRLRRQIADGQIHSANDLVTANLDSAALAQDMIATITDPELLLIFWQAIERMTVLDPTCGSGAFLFAALEVLQPLYEACLDRMAVLTGDAERAGGAAEAPVIARFRQVLAHAAQHPNRPYFILKSIIVNNLYGVDIMEEAIEICKLRLFLKLAAQTEHDPLRPNQGAEILPDMDFNIFAGNALVGYATYAEVREAVAGGGQMRMQLDEAIQQIDARIQQVDAQFQRFRQAQVEPNQQPSTLDKQALQEVLSRLDSELDRYLGSEYGVDPARTAAFAAWCRSHSPFHWFVKFYRVLHQQGGFDVVIGNPPYVGYSKVRDLYSVRGYATEGCNNLYAFAVERSLALLRAGGRYGMIVPIASVSTEGMRHLQNLYAPYRQWHSHWAVRPGKLFMGVDMNLTITLLQKTRSEEQYTTGYRRWYGGEQGDRPLIFRTLVYTPNPQLVQHANPYPKLGSTLETRILQRMLAHGRRLRMYTVPRGTTLYYHSGGRYWRKALPAQLSSHYKPVTVAPRHAPLVFALLNSQLFYWYWISNSNCMDVVSREVLDLPVFPFEQVDPDPFATLQEALLASYMAGAKTRVRSGELICTEEINFDVQRAKPIIDRIDAELARWYGFDDEELDLILHYDIKFRMSREATGEH
ncbi:MAG: hypothetical protein OHK0022_32530 [Roseiflexaceae bacterium]